MLKKGDKINLIKNGKVIATDTVLKVENKIAFTLFGKRFNFKSKILFPKIGHRHGFEFVKAE